MLRPDAIVADLRDQGLLWETAPGVVGMRGELAKLYSSVSAAIAEIASANSVEEWRMPQAVSFGTLERAKYFESFPHWLTVASHLREDDAALERVARAQNPGAVAARSLAVASAALPPAVCYHTYAALADSTINSPVVMTAEETCWRHEGTRLAALERGWAFRMREVVFVGDAEKAEEFRQNGIADVSAFAESVGLHLRIELAEDPFFAPTSRGKSLLQRVKALKHELVVDGPSGKLLAISSFNNHERFFGESLLQRVKALKHELVVDGPSGKLLAISSFNNHERFFGESFSIRLGDGQFATTACVAFGIERWMLAILMTHGTDSSNWPEFGRASLTKGAAR